MTFKFTKAIDGVVRISGGKVMSQDEDFPSPQRVHEKDCCCCCGCLCSCSIDIAGKSFDLPDPTCESTHYMCFLKQIEIATKEATQTETYSETLDCGDDPSMGGITKTVTKESMQKFYIVSNCKTTLSNPPGYMSVKAEQTDYLFSIYYRRISYTLEQSCSIPDDVWRINIISGQPEIISPEYNPACGSCVQDLLDGITGAGLRLCCSADESVITKCEFVVRDGKGFIDIEGEFPGLWETDYPVNSCFKNVLKGPTEVCTGRGDTKGKYVEYNSHSWVNNDSDFVKCSDKAFTLSGGCISPNMEFLRYRRKEWRWETIQPAYDLTFNTICEGYERGDIDLKFQGGSDTGLEPFVIEFEIDNSEEINPNTTESDILGSPVEPSIAMDTETRNDETDFWYEPTDPTCNRCVLELNFGEDKIEFPEPGCFPVRGLCGADYTFYGKKKAELKVISSPKTQCALSLGDVPGAREIYEEYTLELEHNFYIVSVVRFSLFADPVEPSKIYLRIEQDDSMIGIRYKRQLSHWDFGEVGCFNTCPSNPEEDVYFPRYQNFPLTSDCSFAKDEMEYSCESGVIKVNRDIETKWTYDILGPSSCYSHRFKKPPEDLSCPGIRRGDPDTESWTDIVFVNCTFPGGEMVSTCVEGPLQRRVNTYLLTRKNAEDYVNQSPQNICKMLKEEDMEWVLVPELCTDTGVRPGNTIAFFTDGEVYYDFSLGEITAVTGSGVDTTDPILDGGQILESFEESIENVTTGAPWRFEPGDVKITCGGEE